MKTIEIPLRLKEGQPTPTNSKNGWDTPTTQKMIEIPPKQEKYWNTIEPYKKTTILLNHKKKPKLEEI